MNNFIWILLHPSFWIIDGVYSKALDDFYLKAMSENKNIKSMNKYGSIEFEMYRCKINGKVFWTKNYPFSYGEMNEVMPARYTIYLLKQYVSKKLLEQA